MRIDRNEAFRELTPPAGGAARMRARLAAETGAATKARVSNAPQTIASWYFAAAGVAAVALIAVLVAFALRTEPPSDNESMGGELYASADLDRLLGRPSTPFELSVSLGDERLELTEIPTRDPRVRIVRVEETSL